MTTNFMLTTTTTTTTRITTKITTNPLCTIRRRLRLWAVRRLRFRRRCVVLRRS
jgi:hypothetical protein